MTTQSLSGAWQFRQTGTEEWLAAQVPGGVHTDLMAAGRIADPFLGDEELRVQWVAQEDWEYRRTFVVEAGVAAEEHLALVFDGLDTLAEVRLNGKPVGSADNMFRTWRWDVTGTLMPGDNEISVVFRSAVRYCAEREAVRQLDRPKETLPGGPYLRKAPCHFGWDWGPHLPNIGIWQEVRLEGWSVARLADVRLSHSIEKKRAWIEARVEIESPSNSAGPLTATIRVQHPDGRVDSVDAAIPAGSSVADLSIEIANPQLWWPNGLGAQPLYRVEVELAASNRKLEARTYQVGLRTLELRREPDEWGESFTFVVNGVPVFAKGSNWIPADSFPARVTPAQLDALLGAAAATNHNMVRIWGGGYYETETFYDLCDRYGILVWQDFMFACSVYPLTDPKFLANLEVETREQVRRLRHRACLALWCGNNEMERGWTIWGWDRPENADLKAAYLRYFSVTLADSVAAEDSSTSYWPSSPSSGRPLEAPIGGNSGDEHEWIVWHALAPFSAYGHETYRFVSEFGFESLPSMTTVAAFAPDPADWNLGSPMLDHHQRCPSGNARILYYMAQQFRLPQDFPSFVYLSQVLHAEAMRAGVEHWRRLRDRCSGALYWQLNDCWPVSSWASIDYYGRWKALQYATRRFFAPVLLTAEAEAGGVSLAVTNDGAAVWLGEVRWSLERLSGEVVASARKAVEAGPVATTPVYLVPLEDQADPTVRRDTILVAELWREGTLAARSVTTFGPDKQLLLKRPSIARTVEHAAPSGVGQAALAGDGQAALAGDGHAELAGDGHAALSGDGHAALSGDGHAVVRLRSDTLARWVELALDGADVIFDDNYLDLPAGREVSIGFELPAGWTLEQARAALRIRSVIDTYA